MAWTKAKMAVAVGVGVLLAAGTTVVTTSVIKASRVSSPDAIYEEIWKHPDGSSYDALDKAPPVLLIRPTHYPSGGSGLWTTTGKGVWVNADTTELVSFAYGKGSWRMILPNDLGGEHFDYLNTLPRDQQERAFREEIKNRFGLVAHAEKRDTDVMLLVAPTYAVPNTGRAFGIMVLALMAMGVLMFHSGFGVTERFRVIAVLVSLVLFVSFCLPLYLTYTPVGHPNIAGLQGRYYLPVIPLIFIATAFDATRFNWSLFIVQLRKKHEWVAAASILGLIVAWFNIN